MKVLVTNPRGFCAGVVRAIDIVELAIKKYGEPVYVKHQIVHNPNVVSDVEQQGAITVEEIEAARQAWISAVGIEGTKLFFAKAPPKGHIDKVSKKTLIRVFEHKLHVKKASKILATLQDNGKGKYIEKEQFDAWLIFG